MNDIDDRTQMNLMSRTKLGNGKTIEIVVTPRERML